MPLKRQVLTFPVGGGMDTDEDKRWLQPGTWQLIQNGYYDKRNKLVKRPGTQVIPAGVQYQGSSIAVTVATKRLHRVQDQLLMFDETGYFVRSPTTATPWTSVAQFAPSLMGNAVPEVRTVWFDTVDASLTTIAEVGALRLEAWRPGNGSTIRTALFDPLNEARHHPYPGDDSFNGVNPKAISSANWITVWFTDGATLKYRRWNPTNPTAQAVAVTVVAANVTAEKFDVMPSGDAGAENRVYVAYHNSSTGFVETLLWDVASGTQVVAPVSTGHSGDQCMGWHLQDIWTGGSVYLTLASTTSGVIGKTLSKTALTVSATSTLDGAATANVRNVTGLMPGLRGLGSAATAYWEVTAAATYNTILRQCDFGGGVFTRLRSVGLASKPFIGADRVVYVLTSYDSAVQSAYFLVAISTLDFGVFDLGFRIVGRILGTGAAGGQTGIANGLSWAATSGTSRVLPILKRGILERLGADAPITFYRQAGWCKLQFNYLKASRPQEYAGQLYIPAPLPSKAHSPYFLDLAEQAPVLFPEAPTGTPANIGGGALVVGKTYSFVLVYAIYDVASGAVLRSEPSNPVSVNITAGNNAVTLTCPTLRLQRSAGPVLIEVYRTDGDGPIYFQETNLTNFLANNALVDTVSFNSVVSDTALLAGETLYTTGGILGNQLGPPCAVMQAHRERLFAINSEDGSIWFTNRFLPGTLAQFNPKLKVVTDNSDGAPKALASMDDKLVIFKRGAVWVLRGEGPDRRGQNTYQAPEKLAHVIGCDQPLSIVSLPQGVFFKSPKGFFLLKRDLSLEDIGARVSAYDNLTVTGAVAMEDVPQVRWTTVEGTTLVYDWSRGQWSVFTNQPAHGGCALDHNKRFCFTGNDADLLVETPGAYADEGADFIEFRVKAPVVSPAQIRGLSRIYAVMPEGDYVGRSQLVAELRANGSSTLLQPADSVDLDAIDEGGIWAAELKPAVQKVSGLELTLYDQANAGGNTGGFALSAIALEVGIKRGRRKLPAANRMT